MAKDRLFLEWLEREGGYINGDLCLFDDIEGEGRGVIAKKAIKEGQQLLLIPAALCIHYDPLPSSSSSESEPTDQVTSYNYLEIIWNFNIGKFCPAQFRSSWLLHQINRVDCLFQANGPAANYLRSEHSSLSPFLATVLLLLHELSKVLFFPAQLTNSVEPWLRGLTAVFSLTQLKYLTTRIQNNSKKDFPHQSTVASLI